MARIFDNIDNDLLTTLRATMQVSQRSDFCVGYLNLRGWQAIDDLVAPWNPAVGQVCRVLVGMQRPPYEEIRELYRQADETGLIDNATASRLKTQFAAHLREQITLGIPSYGTTDPTERAKLRAALDGLVAHVQGLTKPEFAHILDTFPLVPELTKIAALNLGVMLIEG